MTGRDADLSASRQFAMAQRPRDSATLIVVRHDDARPRILLGQRHDSHAFMPNMFVFPGGRLDAADTRTRFSRDLHPAVLAKLTLRMRGRTSPARARGLAIAAVRETFEETGLLFGFGPGDAIAEWPTLIAHSGPDLSGLRFFARAITPPGRTRRFDSRFFVADARHVANLDQPWHQGSGELLTPHWFGFDEALALELPIITRDILKRLKPLAEARRELQPDHPVCFQYLKGKAWREDAL